MAFGLVGEAPPPEEEPEEAEEEAEEEQPETGGDTTPGKSGGATAGNTQVSAAASSVSPPPPAGAPAPQPVPVPAVSAARIKIVGHRVRGAAVTLVVQVAGPGRLTVGGHGVKAVHRTFAHAGRFSVTLSATRAAAASLHDHHRLRLSLRASFAPTVGAASVAASTITIH